MEVHKWVYGCNEKDYTHGNRVHIEKCMVHKVNTF